MTATKKRTTDFTDGPLFFRIFIYTLPIMATGLLQILYNTADNIVVGRFSGDDLALAAVGSTTGLSALITNFLLGIGGGASIMVAQMYGAKNYDGVKRAAHTIVTFSMIGGVLFCALGLSVSRPALTLMGTKPELMDNALLYLRLICLGIPASAVYNFGAGILRATGDSKTSLNILSFSGLLNVVLNLIFVIVFDMSVAGVAIATITSQYVSATRIIVYLVRRKNECFGIRFSELRIDKRMLLTIFRYGIPTGINSSMYSLSAVFMSTAINTLPTAAVSARTIANNIDQMCHTTIASFSSTALTVTGQNFGAKKPERIKKALFYMLIQVAACGILIGQTLLLFSDNIASLFIDSANPSADQILAFTVQVLSLTLATSFINGTWQMLSGALRGMGYSITSMLTAILGACVFRILWITFVFPLKPMNNILGLYTMFPISWILTGIMLSVALLIAYRKLLKEVNQTETLGQNQI